MSADSTKWVSPRESVERKQMHGGYSLGYYLPRLRGQEEKGKRRLRQSSGSWNRHWSVPSKSLDPLKISDRPGHPKLVVDYCLLHAKFLSSTCGFLGGFWNLYLPCLGALWGFVPFFRIWSQCLFLSPVFLFWSLVGARGGGWADPASSCWKWRRRAVCVCVYVCTCTLSYPQRRPPWTHGPGTPPSCCYDNHFCEDMGTKELWVWG